MESRRLVDLRSAFKSVLGETGVIDEPQALAAHAGDWSEAPKCSPSLLLLPRTPEQVATIMRLCTQYRQPIAVQGGLTGLAGGATPQAGEIALSLGKLSEIEDIDVVGGTALVQAGVILQELQRRVEEEGWSFPLDLGARGSCHVGGNAATNAGGNRVIRYGTMRDLVLGLEVVLPDGRLMTMLNRTTKNTTGVELKHLFIGAEGSLGIITRLVLKLSPRPTSSCTALCALPSFEAAARLLRDLRRELPSLSAFELMWADFMEAAIEIGGLRPPFSEPHPVYVLLETLGGDTDPGAEQLVRLLGYAVEQDLVQDAIVAQSLEDAGRLWAYREAIGELLDRLKPYAAFDVGVPMARMALLVDSVRMALEQCFPSQRSLFFGHLGDGNLHVLCGPFDSSEQLHAAEELVYRTVGGVGGSISGEHGIGVVKREFLHLSRSPGELDLMRSLKALLDPHGLLNRGRIVSEMPPL